MSLIVSAMVICSRWMAQCPRCGTRVDPASDASAFKCWMCETQAEIHWPPGDMMLGIERLLLMRPDPMTRNWLPGETLHDLMRENAEHGVFSDLPEDSGTLIIDSERIRVDTLPLIGRRELKAIG